MMEDPIVDEVHRASERLIKQFGGIDGYFKHIQQLDRARRRRDKQRIAKKVASNGRKDRKRPARTRTRRAVKVG